MKRFLIVVLVISAMLSAAFVDQTAAKKAAENYYKNYAPASAKGNGVTNIFAHEYEGQVTWYGVSFDQGFVLISADDAVRAILGYSFEGKIANPDERDGGLAFKEWFGYYDKQIAVARKYSYVDAAAQTEWKNIKNNSFPKASKSIMVDALCKAKWDQVWPWNDLCPEKDGTWTYVGCVATAASIIAKYHEWPTTGTGSNTNTSAGTTETYSNYTFDYSVMKDEPVIEYGLYPVYWESIDMDAAAIQTMAELNYLTGHSFDMSYGTTADGGSGANMSASSTAFQTHWFYNTTYATVGTPTDPTYIASTIQAELDAKRPWWWAGGVHSFVLDGYTDDYWYHFNWGWGGYEDGWYQINYLVPGGIGSGGGDGDYTASQIR
ncbi:MAG: C10 family peptidase, partial [Candidatus Delongbacteria bacterium]|nr:C10 family peptidase [Candidatus Delongbacteria bacterium]